MVNSPRALTKIVLPNRSRRLLYRPRLVNFLHDHLEHKLIVISASAGYGKTSLLIDFVHETSLPVCWYSLDDSDRDPQVFLEYLTASVNRQFPTIGEQAQRVLASGEPAPGFDAVVGALINEIQDNLTKPFVIVLDDYHTVAESEAVNHIVETLLFLSPATVHLIISSRTLPTQLPLTRLQVRQQVAGLGCGDLQFTAEEIQALVMQNHQIQLSAQQAVDLAKQSEGWIASILLTTPYLWEGLFHRLVEGHGAQEKLFHYLASEAFTRLPSELQQFLLDSSVLSRLEAATCDALLGTQTAAALLHTLEEQNLFIVRLNGESAEPSYRYHHLFQEFLRHRLRETDATRWRDLNRRAAALFEVADPATPSGAREGSAGQAIVHYLAAEMYDEAACAIEKIAQAAYDEGRWVSLASWIDALTAEVLNAHPSLIVTRGMLFAETGNSEETERAYSRALEIYNSLDDELAAARVIVWRALFWRLQGRYREAIQACDDVLETLRRHGAQTDEARAYRILGSAHALLGDISRGAKELEQALKLYEALHDEVRVAWLHHDIGTYLRLQGDPSAEGHYATALDYWRRTRNLVGEAMTLNSIGVGQHQAGDLERARTTLEQACALAHHSGNRRNEAFALTSLGDVYRDQGELARALEAYQAARSIAEQVDGFVLVYALVALGEAHHLSGNAQEAERCLARALEEAQAHQSSYEIGLVETAIGIWKCQQRQTESAIAHLSHAVDLLKPACRDRARARLHLARAYFLHRKYARAKQHLRALARECGAPKDSSIPFLLADRQQLLPLLKYAVSHRVAKEFFLPIFKKLDAPAKPAAAVHFSTVQVRALGIGQVLLDDKPLTKTNWVSNSTKELFFLLLVHREGLRREQILEILWERRSASEASVIFHSTTYRLRRAIPNCLVHEDGVYRLNPEMDFNDDVTQFAEALRRAEKARSNSERIKHYTAAVNLYRGDYLEDVYSDWCMEIRERLRCQYLDALFALAEIYERRGNLAQAMEHYRTCIEKNRDREEAYRALMRLQFRVGDRAGAARTYQQCVQALRDELDIPSPSQETQALYEAITKDRRRTGSTL